MIQGPQPTIVERLSTAWHGLVGVVNSSVDFAIFSFAYYLLALPIIAANTLAWVVAVSGSYILNSSITFAHESGRRLGVRSYLAFALSQFAGFLANTATVWCLVTLGHRPAWAAKIAAIIVSFVVNFSLSHFVVFRPRKQP
jgi:putative flippase GtrA